MAKTNIGTNPASLAAHIVRVLTKLGWHEDTDARTSKYRVFAHVGRSYNFYVGLHGTLRHGSSVATSIALFEGNRDKLEKWLEINEKFHTATTPLAEQLKARRDEEVY